MKNRCIKLIKIIVVLIIIFVNSINPIQCLKSGAVENETENASKTLSRLADVVEIGDYVNYDASSGDGAGKSYTTNESFTGSSTETTFSSSDDMKWRVLSVDKESGIVELMSEDPTANTLTLYGKEGYINAEDVLNDIGAVYGHGNGAISGRSIKKEDIEQYFTNSSDLSKYVSIFGYRYGEIETYSSGTFINTDDEIEVTGGIVSEDDPRLLIASTNKPVRVAQTFYSFEEHIENKSLYNMLFGEGKMYYIASRYSELSPNCCYFGIRRILWGSNYSNQNLFCSENGYNIEATEQVVPVISLVQDIKTTGQINGTWELAESELSDNKGKYKLFTYIINDNNTVTIIKCDETASGEITVPDEIEGKKVVEIGTETFLNCNKISKINLSNNITEIKDGAFKFCKSLESISIPDGIQKIGNSLFYECNSLKNIELPSTILEIGEKAFYGCKNIQNILIPFSVTSIGRSAFENCTKLININIPDTVTEINNSTFRGCLYLSNIVIPTSVKSIKSGAFSNCTNLSKITIRRTATDIEENVFENFPNILTIYGDKESVAEEYANKYGITFKYISEEEGTSIFTFGRDNYSFFNSKKYFTDENTTTTNTSFEYWNLLTRGMTDSTKFIFTILEYGNVLGLAKWGGSCFGIASTEALFYRNFLDEKDFGDKDTVYELNAPIENKKLKDVINFYMYVQKLPDVENICADNYLKSMVNDYEFKLDDSNVLREMIDNFKNGNNEQIISIEWKDADDKWHGHAILGFGYDEGEYYIDGQKYKYKVRICDSNIGSEEYIYIKEDYSDWFYSIGELYGIVKDYNGIEQKNIQSTIYADIFERYNPIIGINNAQDTKYNNSYLIVNDYDGTPLQILNETRIGLILENRTINPIKYTSEELADLIARILSEFDDSTTSNEENKVTVALENLDHYTIIPQDNEKNIDITMAFPDATYKVQSTNTNQVYMENTGKVVLDANNSQYDILMGTNEHTMPWYAFEISGDNANSVTIENTVDGIVLESNNLKNIEITARDDFEQVSLTLNTEEEKVLVKSIKNDTLLGVYADIDKDENYETLLVEASPERISATLNNLEISKVELNNSFSSKVVSYEGTTSESKISLTPTLKSGTTANIKLNGGETFEFIGTQEFELQDGENYFVINAMEDGKNMTTYLIKITKNVDMNLDDTNGNKKDNIGDKGQNSSEEEIQYNKTVENGNDDRNDNSKDNGENNNIIEYNRYVVKTGDIILIFVGILVISLILLISTIIIKKYNK